MGHLTVITAAFREKRVWIEEKNAAAGTGNGTVAQVPTKPAEHPKKNWQKERERGRGKKTEGERVQERGKEQAKAEQLHDFPGRVYLCDH